ncbi:hypothetical protein DH2020_009961 [Rehmannia glutinosa]|uniref:4-coumarate--CoA ligase n=1 Tax=Rehmannia glutinosa TaxID=99300 RepID=A0ABR0X7R1_REHGL
MTISTLTGLLNHVAGIFPSRRAISVSGKFDLTHAQLHQLVEGAAAQLISAGVKPGDVVALTFPNTVEFVIMFLAVIRVRATAAPLNAAYTFDEFEFYLSDSESKLLLTSKEGNEPAQAAAAKLSIPHLSATLPAADSEIQLFPTQSDVDTDSLSKLTNDPSDVALFLHTSGTTSRPKGVPLTQQNLYSSVQNIKSVYKITESDSTVIVLPLFHVHGLLAGLLSSLGAGAAVALPAAGRFSASTFWSDMIKYNATWRRLARPVLEAYAMTEATHLMASNPLPEDGPHKPSSVGKPVGQEMAILDESGVVKGLMPMARIKELINRGGEKISPIEVDAVLLSHPDVAQAVAFGVPDDKYGEEINCAVIPRDGSNLDEAEVSRFCKKNLAAFKVPKKVFITDSLPKTATGKIQRRIVSEHFLAQISTAKVPKFGA